MRIYKISLENNDGEFLRANLIIRKNHSYVYHGEDIDENNYVIKTDFNYPFWDKRNIRKLVNGVSFENAVRNYLHKQFSEFKNHYFKEIELEGDLRRERIKLEELKELLRNQDEVKFSFRKKSGERRVAIATLKHESIENSGYVFPVAKPENSDKPKRKPRENVLNFFDLKEIEWRSCSTLLNEDFNLYDSIDEELADEDKTKEIVSEFYNDGETDETLRTDLSMGVVKFHFQKVNGEERIAIGTTNYELLSLIDVMPDEKVSDTSCIRFFDLMKKEWRAAKLGTILSVEYKAFNMRKEDFLELCNTILSNMEK